MHEGEITPTAAQVAALIREQFPRWAALPLTAVPSAGTEYALFRLGERFVARLPRLPGSEAQIAKEQRWLPQLAAHLPLAIPRPLALGRPGAGYPAPWSVYTWIAGEPAIPEATTDPPRLARDLGAFIRALQRLPAGKGTPPGAHNSGRGEPLARRDAETRRAIAGLAGEIDAVRATAVWEAALAAPPWSRPPVWVHGDLQEGNLLARDGRLCAVIDFGCLGVGDPAVDVMAAWLYLPAAARPPFRAALAVDEATWTRARGWALSVGLIALPYYRHSNPVLAGIARRAIAATTADQAAGA